MSLSKSLIVQPSPEIKSESNWDPNNQKEEEPSKNTENSNIPTTQSHHKRIGSEPKFNEIKLPKIKIKKANEILGEIYKYKSEHGPLFFLTNSQNEKDSFNNNGNKKQKNKNNLFKVSNNTKVDQNYKDLAEFNVFNSEDKMIRNLMHQFYKKKNSKKPTKAQRKREVLNKLYGFQPDFFEKLNEIKQQKNLSLDTYQNNILMTLSNSSMDQEELMNLLEQLNELKDECKSVTPLPPINIKNIYDHVYNQNKNRKERKLTLKEILDRSNEPKDEFEKEERLINKIKGVKSVPRKKRNKNFDKLPEYLKEIFSK